MGINTRIDWTDHTWNPWQGCERVSEGCANCYMYSDKKRYGQVADQVVRSATRTFNQPNRIKEPGLVFVCSWSDFYIDDPVANACRHDAYVIMQNNPHLTFQLLTKRPENINEMSPVNYGLEYDMENVWIGTTIENQRVARDRINSLSGVYHHTLFLSVEPLLGPVDLFAAGAIIQTGPRSFQRNVDWVIVGGESGAKARYMDPVWVSIIKADCKTAGIPFFMKQMSGRTKKERTNIPVHLDSREFPKIYYEKLKGKS